MSVDSATGRESSLKELAHFGISQDRHMTMAYTTRTQHLVYLKPFNG